MDAVFRALADPGRRTLLDSLRTRNGQNLRELCAGLDMARQSVSKHLAILESAGLVTTVKHGREKLHYLNPAPISEIGERWISHYDRGRVDALADLKRALEEPTMSKTPAELKYAPTHEWVRIEGDIATVGITDHAQDALGDLVYVELPEVGDTVAAHDEAGVVESVKAASDIYAPVSGEIVAVTARREYGQTVADKLREILQRISHLILHSAVADAVEPFRTRVMVRQSRAQPCHDVLRFRLAAGDGDHGGESA